MHRMFLIASLLITTTPALAKTAPANAGDIGRDLLTSYAIGEKVKSSLSDGRLDAACSWIGAFAMNAETLEAHVNAAHATIPAATKAAAEATKQARRMMSFCHAEDASIQGEVVVSITTLLELLDQVQSTHGVVNQALRK